MTSFLNFLKTSTVEEAKTSQRTGGPGNRKQRNPAPAIVAIRVWKDGSIFPSQAAVDKFDLEYRPATITKEPLKLKDGETEADQKFRNKYDFPKGTGNGFDIIDSRLWAQFKSEGAMLFIIPVLKSLSKVDLFNTVAYEEDGSPKSSVMEQGTATYGKDVLIPAIEEIYGIKFNRSAVPGSEDGLVPSIEAITDGVDFVDLAIFESLGEGADAVNIVENFSKPIIHVPKRITRGKDKGQADYERRENVKVHGLAPAAEVIAGYKPESAEEEKKA